MTNEERMAAIAKHVEHYHRGMMTADECMEHIMVEMLRTD